MDQRWFPVSALLVSLGLLPPSFIGTWQCNRTQPAKGYKIKNEKAYTKKWCKLVQGCTVKRHKTNGHKKGLSVHSTLTILIYFIPFYNNIFISYNKSIGFGGLGVVCWPLVPKFVGSNPAEAVRFLGRKNPQHAFLRRGSKAVGPMS